MPALICGKHIHISVVYYYMRFPGHEEPTGVQLDSIDSARCSNCLERNSIFRVESTMRPNVIMK